MRTDTTLECQLVIPNNICIIAPSINSKIMFNTEENSEKWKTFNVEKAVEQDIRAAISLLSMIMEHKEVLAFIVQHIESIRKSIIDSDEKRKLDEQLIDQNHNASQN